MKPTTPPFFPPNAARQPRPGGQPSNEDINQLLALFNSGRYAELESQARAMLERYPAAGFLWKCLGAALQVQGKEDEAFMPLNKAAQLLPNDVDAHTNLGNALKSRGQPAEAEASYRRALSLNPNLAEVHSNLGNALHALDRFAEAEASCRRAIALKPDFAPAYSNLGNALQGQERLAEAEDCYRRAIKLSPGFAEPYLNLADTLKNLDRLDEVAESYRQALSIKPDNRVAFDNLLFYLNYHPDLEADEIFAAYREFDRHFGLPLRAQWRPHGNSRQTQRRLKVGYVSADFHRHSCQHFLEPLLANHRPSEVEVYVYAEREVEDEVTLRYRSYVEHWLTTHGMSDDALAERIRADGIDILVDLAGHTADNRLAVFARKPAPVSLSWLGYGYSTGLSAVDYFLSDATNTPPGYNDLFAEQPWRLATPGYAYRPAAGMGAVSPLPAEERGYVTFGTLTRAVHINRHSIRVWSEILHQVPGSRLIVDSRNFASAVLREHLLEQFAAHGIDRARLDIGFHSPPWDVLRGMDIGLDCFPHNSGTTLFESLYLGVPFVTLAGRPSVGRLGSSILESVGHREWIAGDEEEYIETAIALAADLPRLAAVRAGLRQQMEASPVMDEAGFACKVEEAYRQMFERWAQQ
jgi:predicted O-linked N-acetylglucosamine transferase (SPINDLY family)